MSTEWQAKISKLLHTIYEKNHKQNKKTWLLCRAGCSESQQCCRVYLVKMQGLLSTFQHASGERKYGHKSVSLHLRAYPQLRIAEGKLEWLCQGKPDEWASALGFEAPEQAAKTPPVLTSWHNGHWNHLYLRQPLIHSHTPSFNFLCNALANLRANSSSRFWFAKADPRKQNYSSWPTRVHVLS